MRGALAVQFFETAVAQSHDGANTVCRRTKEAGTRNRMRGTTRTTVTETGWSKEDMGSVEDDVEGGRMMIEQEGREDIKTSLLIIIFVYIYFFSLHLYLSPPLRRVYIHSPIPFPLPSYSDSQFEEKK